MPPNLLYSLFTFIIIVIATILQVPNSLAEDGRQYDTCDQLLQCGEIQDVGYPFSGENRPDFCGYPGFELTCQFETLLLRYQSILYRVVGINNSTHTITVARDDLWDDTCPQKFYNTTFDFTLFNYDSFRHKNLSLYYDCIKIPPRLTSNQFSCTQNGTSDSFFVRTDAAQQMDFLGLCSNNVIVPVNQASARDLATNTSPSQQLVLALRSGFKLQWMANNSLCDDCIKSGGRCGSKNSTSSMFACYCADKTYPLICNSNAPDTIRLTSFRIGVILAVALSSVMTGILVLVFVILYRHRRKWFSINSLNFWKREKTNDQNIEAFINIHGPLTPKRYRYSEIKKITNSFMDKLGQGGYGSVYKGRLPSGRLVAVKLLSEAKGDGEDFLNEVASISRTSHVNVVALLGFCFQGKKRALVYEFMPKGSLDKFICNDDLSNTSCRLDWNTLYQIAIGIARGLEYLHRGCNTRIVHFDIKPDNILLDEDFCPKITDFGLAKLCKRKESVVSMLGARGTAGYIAPEVFLRSFGGASHKSDVYSYGMMVLEMAGARNNNNVGVTRTSEAYFPDWLYKKLEVLGEDLGVHGVTTEEEEETARKMILVSFWCIQTNPSDRPSISKVIEMLEGNLRTLQVPPKPFLSSPMRLLQDSSLSLSQSSDNILAPRLDYLI